MLSGSYDPDQSGLGAFQEFPQVSTLSLTFVAFYYSCRYST